jgi:hypothetical protein
MSVKTMTCYVITCDGCGNTLETDYHIPHFDSQDDARAAASDSDWVTSHRVGADIKGDWCEDCLDRITCPECGSLHDDGKPCPDPECGWTPDAPAPVEVNSS